MQEQQIQPNVYSVHRCSAYQRLDAKNALIGMTQVAYLWRKEHV